MHRRSRTSEVRKTIRLPQPGGATLVPPSRAMAGGALFAVLLLSAVAAVGCRDAAEPGPAPDNSGGIGASVTQHGGATQPKPIPASTLAIWLPNASDFERTLLVDGQLTLSEYEGAKLAEVQCLRESGLEVLDPHMNGIYLYRFVVKYESATGKQPDAIGDCKKQYTSVLEAIWAEVSAPLAEKVIAESRRMMADCYKREHLKIEDHPEDSFDPEVFDKYTRCKEQMWSALDIEGISYGVEGDGRPR